MRNSARLLVAIGVALLCVLAAGEEAPDGGPRAPAVHTITGTIAAVRQPDRTVIVETPKGPVTLTVDRNTTVFLAGRVGTVGDLAVGSPVRAWYGPRELAYWIELGARTDAGGYAATDRAAGPGVPVLPAPDPAADASAPDGGSPARASASQPGSDVPAGPSTPEPNSGVTQPRLPPGPAGTGPMPGRATR
jgi:hypothetical protein